MSDYKLFLSWIAVFQIMSLVGLSTAFAESFDYTENAFYLSENNCDKLTNEMTGAPILFAAAHIIVLAKTTAVKEMYGPENQRFSLAVVPKCIIKGDTREKEIIVRNLGATACGSLYAELHSDYLFFLRKTADPKVFEAVNTGAKAISGPILWSPIFTLFCGITRIEKCTKGTCPMACSYSVPGSNACIPPKQTVYDTYKQLYPNRKRTMTTTESTTTRATTTKTTTKTTTTTATTVAATLAVTNTTRRPRGTTTTTKTTTTTPTTITTTATTRPMKLIQTNKPPPPITPYNMKSHDQPIKHQTAAKTGRVKEECCSASRPLHEWTLGGVLLIAGRLLV